MLILHNAKTLILRLRIGQRWFSLAQFCVHAPHRRGGFHYSATEKRVRERVRGLSTMRRGSFITLRRGGFISLRRGGFIFLRRGVLSPRSVVVGFPNVGLIS